MKIVHIQWVDPCFSASGWMPIDDFIAWIKTGHTKSDTVGFLAYEDEQIVVVLQSIGEVAVSDGVKITREAIKEIKVLGELPITLDLGKFGKF